MRLSIYEQFVVGVVRPNGGWSKGRPIAYIEEDDKCVPLVDLLIPNDLDDQEIVRYVGDRFRAFAQAGMRVTPLTRAPIHARQMPKPTTGQRGVAHPQAFAGVQH
jgi:hypothetical protein